MDVTPGPQLRRQITAAQNLLDNYSVEIGEWEANPDLPEPAWMSWSEGFRARLQAILPLVRS